jgi:hypothetical protein
LARDRQDGTGRDLFAVNRRHREILEGCNMKMKELSELIIEYQDVHSEIMMYLDQVKKLENVAGELSAVIDHRLNTETSLQSMKDV